MREVLIWAFALIALASSKYAELKLTPMTEFAEGYRTYISYLQSVPGSNDLVAAVATLGIEDSESWDFGSVCLFRVIENEDNSFSKEHIIQLEYGSVLVESNQRQDKELCILRLVDNYTVGIDILDLRDSPGLLSKPESFTKLTFPFDIMPTLLTQASYVQDTRYPHSEPHLFVGVQYLDSQNKITHAIVGFQEKGQHIFRLTYTPTFATTLNSHAHSFITHPVSGVTALTASVTGDAEMDKLIYEIRRTTYFVELDNFPSLGSNTTRVVVLTLDCFGAVISLRMLPEGFRVHQVKFLYNSGDSWIIVAGSFWNHDRNTEHGSIALIPTVDQTAHVKILRATQYHNCRIWGITPVNNTGTVLIASEARFKINERGDIISGSSPAVSLLDLNAIIESPVGWVQHRDPTGKIGFHIKVSYKEPLFHDDFCAFELARGFTTSYSPWKLRNPAFKITPRGDDKYAVWMNIGRGVETTPYHRSAAGLYSMEIGDYTLDEDYMCTFSVVSPDNATSDTATLVLVLCISGAVGAFFGIFTLWRIQRAKTTTSNVVEYSSIPSL